MENTILKMSNISKSFSGVQVLDGVNFELRSGEVHVLMGENGAGKSTLMKILTGVYKPNDGDIYLADETGELKKTAIENPKAALALGISMVFQEFNLMPNMSIAENISIGFEPTKRGVIDWNTMNREAEKMLAKVGLSIPVTTEVGRLTTAEKQGVEIAKCLSHDGRIIILDEPTSSLSEREVRTLFDLIKELKSQGISIVYISHRMEEIFEIGDRITVFRDGHSVATLPVKDVCESELIKLMIGREVEDKVTERRSGEALEPAIELRGVKSRKYDTPVNFTAYKGEIVGIFGLVGAGRTELARVIFGVDPSECGEIIKDGRPITVKSPSDAIKNRIGMIPEDRKEYGLITRHDVQSNLTLVKLREMPWFLKNTRREEKLTDEYIEKLSIATKSRHQLLERLSGGNQQKVVIAKWISMELDVIILDEPTRGVDVKAKAEIYDLMLSLADKGKCVIMISSDLPEIMRVSHRVVVMHDGILTLDKPTAELDQEKILYAALN